VLPVSTVIIIMYPVPYDTVLVKILLYTVQTVELCIQGELFSLAINIAVLI
jgi:hypothetical protein